MAATKLVLGQLAPSAATLSSLYTVPADKEAVGGSLIACNRSATATSFRVAVRPAGEAIADKHYIYYDLPMPGKDAFLSTTGICLAQTDVVSVYATLATLSFGLFGDERTPTTATKKVLGQSAPAAATLTTLYTVPAANEAAASTLFVCNRSATPTHFRVAVRPLGAGISDEHYLYYDVPITGNDTFAATLPLCLTATDEISVYATLATLSFSAFGDERSTA